MEKVKLANGVLHELPNDMENILLSSEALTEKWNSLTDIARNEWICWVTIVKKHETRDKHLKRMSEDLQKGKKRPCCWPGCPHRNPNSMKWFNKK